MFFSQFNQFKYSVHIITHDSGVYELYLLNNIIITVYITNDKILLNDSIFNKHEKL